MKQKCVFKVQGQGSLYKVMREPVDYVAGGYVYRLYCGRKQAVKGIWTSEKSCVMMALYVVLGYNVDC